MDKLTKSPPAIKLILLAAMGSVLFTAGSAFLLFRNTQNLTSAGRWAEHTQKVFLSIQGASDMTQRSVFEKGEDATTRPTSSRRESVAEVLEWAASLSTKIMFRPCRILS